jgi:subtilisin family serine protease
MKHIFYFLLVLSILPLSILSPVQSFIPNDPEGDPWHLNAIGVPSVWDYGYDFRSGSDSKGLCIIGSPITNDQNGDLDITRNISFAWNSLYTEYLPYPRDGEVTNSHEASIASVAASTINNSIGVAGIVNAPLYCIWPWGSYPEENKEMIYVYIDQLIDIFDWCASQGPVVISMSFIAWGDEMESTDPALVAIREKVTELHEDGKVLFFAASGNQGIELDTAIPQTLPFTRVIGQSNRNNEYTTSNFGANMFLLAPAGVPAYDQTNDRYGTMGGASCSAPIAAASAVLLWNQFPWASNAQIEDALVWGASDILDEGFDEKTGFGVINVEKARNYLINNVPSPNSDRLNWTMTSTEKSVLTSPFMIPFFIPASPIIAVIIYRKCRV